MLAMGIMGNYHASPSGYSLMFRMVIAQFLASMFDVLQQSLQSFGTQELDSEQYTQLVEIGMDRASSIITGAGLV